MPDDWPARIPLPEGITIIGAIRYSALVPEPVRHISLLFDTSLSAPQVHAFYRDRLLPSAAGATDHGAGWSDMEDHTARRMGGFVQFSPSAGFATTTTHDESGSREQARS